MMFRAVFWVVLPCKMIVDLHFGNHFTRQYNPEDSSEHHTRRRENLKSHKEIAVDIHSADQETACRYVTYLGLSTLDFLFSIY
jgi:hypothetical protein